MHPEGGHPYTVYYTTNDSITVWSTDTVVEVNFHLRITHGDINRDR
jgi:hypothetical protein